MGFLSLLDRRGDDIAGGDCIESLCQRSTAVDWPSDAPPPALAPFGDEQAREYQEAWARHLGVPRLVKNSVGMRFAIIPPGEFLRGSGDEEIEAALAIGPFDAVSQEALRSEAPQHRVVLTRPFYLGVHEVTQSQYRQITGTNPSFFQQFAQRAAIDPQGPETDGGLRVLKGGYWGCDAVLWRSAYRPANLRFYSFNCKP